MNKVMIAAALTGGFLLMNSPEAAAHKEVRNVYQPPAYYHPQDHVEYRRAKHMPRWLKRKQGFRDWYRHTKLKRDRRLAWNQLYEIYRWERRWGRTYFRGPNFWNDYYAHRYRHDDRRDDRKRRQRHRHRHHD